MTLYQEISALMSDGKPRTSRQVATELRPEMEHDRIVPFASKVSVIIATKARKWGEFEVVEQIRGPHGNRCKVWRMVR